MGVATGMGMAQVTSVVMRMGTRHGHGPNRRRACGRRRGRGYVHGHGHGRVMAPWGSCLVALAALALN